MLAMFNRYFAKHGQTTFLVLLVAIVIPFIFFFRPGQRAARSGRIFGVDAYGSMFGKPLTRKEFSGHLAAYALEIYQVRGYLPDLDRDRERVIKGLYPYVLGRIRILHEAREQGFGQVTDEQLHQTIRELACFKEKGKFSREKYLEFRDKQLARQRLALHDFHRIMREHIVIARFRARLNGLTVTESELRGLFLRKYTKAKLSVRRFAAADHLAKVKLSKAEIKAEFDRHKAVKYLIPEQKKLQVAVFKTILEPFAPKVLEAEARLLYEQDKPEKYQKEQVRVRHLLVLNKAGVTEEDKRLNRQKAEDLLKTARKENNLAELAKKYSDDPGTKAKGGDLGFFGRGDMVKEFEEAAFALKKNEISDVVETSYGYHLIQKIDERDAIPFAKVKKELESTINKERRQEAQKEAQNKAIAFAERVFTATRNLAYAEVLKAFAKQAAAQHIKLLATPYFDREASHLKGVPGPAGRLIEAAEKLDNTQPLTDIVESGGFFYVACLTGSKPSREPPLAAVKDQIAKGLRQDKAVALARQQAQKLYQRISADLAKGKSFAVAKGDEAFNELEPQSLRQLSWDALNPEEIEAARNTKVGELAIKNTDKGAVLVYVKNHILPSAKEFEESAKSDRLDYLINGIMEFSEDYEKELGKRYPFTPDPEWLFLFPQE